MSSAFREKATYRVVIVIANKKRDQQKRKPQKRKLCVYCGSKFGKDQSFRKMCQSLADEMIHADIDLVYGGGRVGLMGEIANSVAARGGKVYGVIPRGLFQKEVAATDITKLYLVNNMHERKALMEKLADFFVAIPGGWGTLDEFFEIITWRQIGIHSKPVGLLNYKGFFDPLILQMKNMVKQGFVDKDHFKNVIIAKTSRELIKKISKC